MTEVIAELDKQWNKQYEKLAEFKRMNGHCRVPIRLCKQDKPLGGWVSTQRNVYAKDAIRQDRKDLLDEIGFVWKADMIAARICGDDKKWLQQYEKLVELKRKNGHCILPFNDMEDKYLRSWVRMQRMNHTKKTMREDRNKLLDEIGFVWRVDGITCRVSVDNKKWRQQYEKLVEYKRKNGHCIVPKVYEQDKTFGNWVAVQRMNHTKKTMRQDRKKTLDELEFVWKVNIAVRKADSIAARVSGDDKKWLQQYEKLVDFRHKNRHCIVPKVYEQDKAFGNWVAMQRTVHIKKTMRQDRQELLDEIGFVWRVDMAVSKAGSVVGRGSGENKKWLQQ